MRTSITKYTKLPVVAPRAKSAKLPRLLAWLRANSKALSFKLSKSVKGSLILCSVAHRIMTDTPLSAMLLAAPGRGLDKIGERISQTGQRAQKTATASHFPRGFRKSSLLMKK